MNRPTGSTVRTVTLEGNPWFVAQEVLACIALNPNQTWAHLRPLSEDEKRTVTPTTLTSLFRVGRGSKRLTLISESGLYKLIMRSDKPEARAFQDWVTRDVLPAIRKEGMGQPGIEACLRTERPSLPAQPC